jgi:hypothetical protein
MRWPAWADVRPFRWEAAAMGAVLLATLVVAAVRLRAASPDKKQRQR